MGEQLIIGQSLYFITKKYGTQLASNCVSQLAALSSSSITTGMILPSLCSPNTHTPL